jgi:hypothetical protein
MFIGNAIFNYLDYKGNHLLSISMKLSIYCAIRKLLMQDLSMGMSFCNVSFSDLYFSNKRGIVSRALMKFRAAVLGSVAKAP